jgi:hypothetical protein
MKIYILNQFMLLKMRFMQYQLRLRCFGLFCRFRYNAHAVMNLNREDGGKRKYILVEMASISTPSSCRASRSVAFSDSWKEGKASGGKGMSHFVKY